MDVYSFRSAGDENTSNGTSSDMFNSGFDGWPPSNSAELIGHRNVKQPTRMLPADLDKPVSKQKRAEKAVIRIVKKRNSEEIPGKISLKIQHCIITTMSSMLPPVPD